MCLTEKESRGGETSSFYHARCTKFEMYSELFDWESSSDENNEIPDENYDIFPIKDISDFEILKEDTYLVEIDADKHKEDYGDEERALILDFYLLLRYKEGCLRLFEDCNPGPLFFANIVVETDDIVIPAAEYAINFYNNLTKKGKLKLDKVVYANSALWTGHNYFITLSATNIDTGVTALYQAALQITDDVGYVLGLLRDCSTDTVLAILSLKGEGVEEALTTKRKHLKLGLEPQDVALEKTTQKVMNQAVEANSDALNNASLDDDLYNSFEPEKQLDDDE